MQYENTTKPAVYNELCAQQKNIHYDETKTKQNGHGDQLRR